MFYRDLREFIVYLENIGELKRIKAAVSSDLEITEICDRVLRAQGPALLFEQVDQGSIPLLANLFGTPKRVALAMNQPDIQNLRQVGHFLAALKEPQPPQGMLDLWRKANFYKHAFAMAPRVLRRAACQEVLIEQAAVDLNLLPIQRCWPNDVAPLVTWPLVVTKGPIRKRQNIGIYRMQKIGKNRLIVRWLAHRGGALDYQDWCHQNPNQAFPIAVMIGADPAMLIAATTPIPDSLSEYAFAGLLRGHRTKLVSCLHADLQVAASAEWILEGFIFPNDVANEGPFGDHTGYYNEVDSFPVMTITRITHRKQPIYLSTYTGRPPDEPAMLGVALNEVFVPLLQQQFNEIVDFYLPPEGCSYRLAIVAIKKQYAGHAKRIMMGVWSFLRQFMYTKFIIVVDENINVRDWQAVIWAITTCMDPMRDSVMMQNTPIDYLDFASPVSGLGSKMGLDATKKWPGETERQWGIPIDMDERIKTQVDNRWHEYGFE